MIHDRIRALVETLRSIHGWIGYTPNDIADQLDAILKEEGEWQPIAEYQVEASGFGPMVLVEVPASGWYPWAPTYYVAWVEGGEWMARTSDDPVAMAGLHAAPARFMPFSPPPQEPPR